MPIYEYECKQCGTIASLLVIGYTDPEDLVCDACGSTKMNRIISKVNFRLPPGFSSTGSGRDSDDSYYKDSRNIGARAEQMLKQAGVEPSDDFKSKLDNYRSDPSKVLKE